MRAQKMSLWCADKSFFLVFILRYFVSFAMKNFRLAKMEVFFLNHSIEQKIYKYILQSFSSVWQLIFIIQYNGYIRVLEYWSTRFYNEIGFLNRPIAIKASATDFWNF